MLAKDEKYDKLREYIFETRFMSSVESMKTLPQYKELLRYGRDLLPYIYLALESDYDAGWECVALANNILGYNPVPKHFAGRWIVCREIYLACIKEEIGLNGNVKGKA
jgi:hypothetical protein